MPSYSNHYFMGRLTKNGDDRHLTFMMMKLGYKAVYNELAIAYTEVPTTMRKHVKQQLRWRESNLREAIIDAPFIMKHPLLAWEVFMTVFFPFVNIAVRVWIIASIILYPSLVWPVLGSLVVIVLIRNYWLFVADRKLAFYALPYAFVQEFVLVWLYLIVPFKLREQSWGTR